MHQTSETVKSMMNLTTALKRADARATVVLTSEGQVQSVDLKSDANPITTKEVDLV
jgi:hypothetical protein